MECLRLVDKASLSSKSMHGGMEHSPVPAPACARRNIPCNTWTTSLTDHCAPGWAYALRVQQDDNPRGFPSSLFIFVSPSLKVLRINRYYSIESIFELYLVVLGVRSPWRSTKSEPLTFVPLAIRRASRVTSRSIRWKSSLFCSAIRVRIEDEDKYTERETRTARDERRERKWKRESARETGKKTSVWCDALEDLWETVRLGAAKRPSIDEYASCRCVLMCARAWVHACELTGH